MNKTFRITERAMSTARAFESIVVIFKPNSTGDPPKLAEELKASLSDLLPDAAEIALQSTAHAGHAVELAREAASGGRNVLVVFCQRGRRMQRGCERRNAGTWSVP